MSYFRITLIRSAIGLPAKSGNVLKALGLRKRMATVFHPVTPSIAGQIMRVKELVAVSEVDKPKTKQEVHQERVPDPGFYIDNGNGNGSGLSDNEYHDIADEYLDKLVAALEAKAEADETLEVEFSAGVLSIAHKNGTYVINKQPPNKQIWLSSPVSGPKRYDWVTGGVTGQDEKEGTEFATGDDGRGGWWVYARDGSRLSALLKREVGVEVNQEDE
ncbi:hypothetical protein DV735_g5154, partial [Chaetothyriales sp. CBS 134920]